MTVLVTGAGGQVGQALCPALQAAGLAVRAAPRAALDITDAAAVKAALAGVEVAVNLAAYTAVDRAEAEPELADRVNRAGAGIVALAAAAAGIPLIHLSTDFVFDGTGPAAAEGRGYREDDPARPLCVYGASKLAGERAVAAAAGQALILRTAWIFSAHGSNFVRTMLRLSATQPELRVVADQQGSPTWAGDIAAAILAVLGRLRSGSPIGYGIYHFAGVPRASWHDLAVAALQAAGASCPVRPIGTADWPTAARRPPWSVLDSSRFAGAFGHAAPDWRRALPQVAGALAGGPAGPL